MFKCKDCSGFYEKIGTSMQMLLKSYLVSSVQNFSQNFNILYSDMKNSELSHLQPLSECLPYCCVSVLS